MTGKQNAGLRFQSARLQQFVLFFVNSCKYLRQFADVGVSDRKFEIRVCVWSGVETSREMAAVPDSRAAEIYRTIARRVAVKVAERAKDMTHKFPNIVVQNT